MKITDFFETPVEHPTRPLCDCCLREWASCYEATFSLNTGEQIGEIRRWCADHDTWWKRLIYKIRTYDSFD